jgi:hypothetical protein
MPSSWAAAHQSEPHPDLPALCAASYGPPSLPTRLALVVLQSVVPYLAEEGARRLDQQAAEDGPRAAERGEDGAGPSGEAAALVPQLQPASSPASGAAEAKREAASPEEEEAHASCSGRDGAPGKERTAALMLGSLPLSPRLIRALPRWLLRTGLASCLVRSKQQLVENWPTRIK